MAGSPLRPGRAVAWLAWLAAVLIAYFLAGAWALDRHLQTQSARQLERLADGWRWSFDKSHDLVGGRTPGLATRLAEGGIVGERGAGDGYLALNFRGELLDAKVFTRLRVTIELADDDALRLYHRARLDGRIFAAGPIPLSAGIQTLELDLAALDWRVFDAPAQPGAWGGDSGTVAALRLHPLSRPGGFRLEQVRILPERVPATLPRLDLEQARAALVHGEAAPRLSTVGVDALDQRPATLFSLQRQLEPLRPAWAWTSVRAWPPIPPSLWPLAAGVLLALGAISRDFRAGCWLAALAASGLWLLMAPVESGWPRLLLPGAFLLAATGLLLATLKPRLRLGSMAGWRPALLWLAALAIVPLAGSALGDVSDPEPARRLLVYLPWAALQQSLLHAVLIPAAGGHERATGRALGATVFGLLHFPNTTLMGATLLLGLLTGALYRRHRALPPLVLLHAALGTLYLECLPRSWLWSGDVGMRFFG